MTSTLHEETRDFRLTPRDREGVLFGLSYAQLLVLGGGCITGVVVLLVGLPNLLAAVPAAVGGVLAYGRKDGLQFLDWVAPLLHYARSDKEWMTDKPFDGQQGELPKCLAGLGVTEASWETGAVGVVLDGTSRQSAVIKVEGRDFALLDPGEKVDLLDGWGRVLATHAVEESPVASISWSEIAHRANVQHHLRWIESLGEQTELVGEYRELIRASAPRTSKHSTYVTVSVEAAKVRGARDSQSVTEALRAAVASTLEGLRSAGLDRCRLLDKQDVMSLLSTCVHPIAASGSVRTMGGLSQRLDLASPADRGPGETWLEFAWWETDRCAHVTMVIEDWPRFGVEPGWLTTMLAGGRWARRMTVHLEPMPQAKALKGIENQAFQLDASEKQREESGRRVGASWRKQREFVDRREEEIVAGYPQVRYVGLITVSGTSGDELDDAVNGVVNAARTAGISLRVLLGQQDLGWAASLPLGLGASEKVI